MIESQAASGNGWRPAREEGRGRVCEAAWEHGWRERPGIRDGMDWNELEFDETSGK